MQLRESDTDQTPIPGFFTWFGYDLPIVERFRKVKAASFHKVSIWLGEEEELVRTDRLHEFAVYAKEAEVELECAHASYNGCNLIWDGSDQEKQQLFDEFRKQIYFCKLNKVPILVMHIVGGASPPAPNEDGYSFMKSLIGLASDSDVKIALENTRKTDAVYYLLDRIDSPFLGLCYDSSHDFLYAEQPTKILRDWGPRLIYTHFSDNDGEYDSHWLPGTGVVDWNLIKAAFPKNSANRISLEVVPENPNSESIEKFLKKAYKIGNWLVGELLG